MISANVKADVKKQQTKIHKYGIEESIDKKLSSSLANFGC